MVSSRLLQVLRTVRELIEWFRLGPPPYRFACCIFRDVTWLLRSLPGFDLRRAQQWPRFSWMTTPPPRFDMGIDGEILAHLYRSSSLSFHRMHVAHIC